MNFLSKFRFTLTSGIAITILSLIPKRHLPESDFNYADIAVHILLYAVWMILLRKDLNRIHAQPSRDLILKSAIVLLVYGGILEILQESLVEGRHGSFADFAANATGIFLGSLIFRKQSRLPGQ